MSAINRPPLYPVLPGLGLSVAIAFLAKFFATYLPQLGAGTLAIIIGIALGNTVFKHPNLATGTKFAESKLLEWAVVLLGFTVTFQTFTQLGFNGFIFVILLMTVTILVAYIIGNRLSFTQSASLLMAGGSAVCGTAAIGAIAPAIEANDRDKGQIITLVNLQGTLMMLSLPFLAKFLFHDDLLRQSALIGGTLPSVGQVVAGGTFLGEQAVILAMLFKISRIILLIMVVLAFERFTKKEATKTTSQPLKLPIPWYVLGFFLVCLLNSFFTLPDGLTTTTKFISGWFEVTALAAIGLRLDFRKFIQEGPKFIKFGLTVGISQTLVAVILIYLLAI